MNQSLTREVSDGLFLIDLPQSHPGFCSFISAWYFKDANGRNVLVDPGPASTIPVLNQELEKLTATGAASNIDLVLMAHIHLDHAGSLGQFVQRWPNVRCLMHPRGFSHMRNPKKLWDSSVGVLGAVADVYGEPVDIPNTVAFLEEDDPNLSSVANSIEVFETPGHAPHHISFRAKAASGQNLFFIGEAAGTVCPTLDGSIWTRPATPPRFDPIGEAKTLDLLESVLTDDDLVCFAHWGILDSKSIKPQEYIRTAREQLKNWTAIIASMREVPEPEIVAYILEHDPLLQGEQGRLTKELYERERIFMSNSVRGILKTL